MPEITTGLTKERQGEIAVLFLLRKHEKEGITINPSTVKREIHNGAKDLKIDEVEMAESLKIIYQHIFEKTMEELNNFISTQRREDRASIS